MLHLWDLPVITYNSTDFISLYESSQSHLYIFFFFEVVLITLFYHFFGTIHCFLDLNSMLRLCKFSYMTGSVCSTDSRGIVLILGCEWLMCSSCLFQRFLVCLCLLTRPFTFQYSCWQLLFMHSRCLVVLIDVGSIKNALSSSCNTLMFRFDALFYIESCRCKLVFNWVTGLRLNDARRFRFNSLIHFVLFER